MKTMKQPYVTAHMLSTIDGRINVQNSPVPHLAKLFESTAARIKADAWIVGRTTMQEFASKKPHRLGKPDASIPKTDFIGVHSTRTYAVAIDPSGKCRWDTNMVTTEHVIEVLTERVSTAYLKHLRDKQVSYIFAGKRDLDLRLALQKLNALFGVNHARIDGGGFVWGSFLEAGLIDEISHIIVPIADGTMGTPTMFDIDQDPTTHNPAALRLKSVKKLPGGVLWVRYLARR
jgi:riboflavin biosynthesis pyrimidine reductase